MIEKCPIRDFLDEFFSSLTYSLTSKFFYDLQESISIFYAEFEIWLISADISSDSGENKNDSMKWHFSIICNISSFFRR